MQLSLVIRIWVFGAFPQTSVIVRFRISTNPCMNAIFNAMFYPPWNGPKHAELPHLLPGLQLHVITERMSQASDSPIRRKGSWRNAWGQELMCRTFYSTWSPCPKKHWKSALGMARCLHHQLNSKIIHPKDFQKDRAADFYSRIAHFSFSSFFWRRRGVTKPETTPFDPWLCEKLVVGVGICADGRCAHLPKPNHLIH